MRTTSLLRASAFLFAASHAAAQTEVSVMPGYPNAPFTSPSERFVARDGQPLRLWGNVNQGLSAPAGATYEWYIASNGNVSIADDGDRTGPITDPKQVVEDVTFTLLNGSEREILDATLMVTDPAGGGGQRTLQILVLGDEDPDVDTPLEELEVDARIAVQRAKWFLYQSQGANDEWEVPGYSPAGAIPFVLWGLQNQGHSERHDPHEDIFAPVIARAYDELFGTYGVVLDQPTDIDALRATVALGATQDGVSDMNQNGQSIRIGTFTDASYYNSLALAAIIASNDPDLVVRTGELAGMTFREVVEDGIDYIGAHQNQGDDSFWSASLPIFVDGRGGWDYEPESAATRSDMSINGWVYVAMEGAIDVFGIDVPQWIKREVEHTLIGHMRDDPGTGQPYGYTTRSNTGNLNGLATTGAGLTGLTIVYSGDAPGEIVDRFPLYGFDDLAQQRTEALRYLGEKWDRPEPGAFNSLVTFGTGNRGNFYVMWSVARGLRATATSLGLPEGENIPLEVMGDLIDWETGARVGQNEVPQGPREGYWSYLRRTQVEDLSDPAYGAWAQRNQIGAASQAAVGLLILTRGVFLDPCPDVVQIPVEDLSPAAGGGFEAGVPFTFTGRALREAAERPVTDVYVNGRSVESLDAAGRFFTTLMLDEGPNQIDIEAFDECGSTVTTVTLDGITVGGGFDQYGDVSPFLELNFRNTTFNQANQWLVVDVEACSTYDAPLSGPILLALDATSTAAVQAVNADGTLPDGRPYFVFVADGVTDALQPGACTQPRQLIFDNPELAAFTFESTWLSPGNGPPAFRTSPPSRAFTQGGFVYPAEAVDPEGADVTYALLTAPAGMAVGSDTGEVTWAPTEQDVGTHQVVLEARDGTVGSSRQSWTLEVLEGTSNQPPFFTSAPPVQASVGATYAYQPTAEDPNRDAVAFFLEEGPAGMAIDGAGRLSWDFALRGEYPVVVRATDPFGAYAVQGYTLSVGMPPSNPHAPTLDGLPNTTAIAGSPYRYQPVATDPDPGDVLAFSLDDAPIGMDVDGATGLVTWTPGTTQVGVQGIVLRVEDGAGGFAQQSWSIDVALSGGNQPPSIVSLPARVALLGAPYSYQLEAYDPEGAALTYEVAAGPPELSVNPTTGLVSWTPATAGSVQVGLRVVDPGGAVGVQAFEVDVLAANSAPTIVSTPGAAATVGATYYYDVNALDPEGQGLTYGLAVAPGGVTIDPVSGVVRWDPTLADVGTRSFEVICLDVLGAEARQAFDVTVSEDSTAPTVDVTASPAVARLGEPVELCVVTGDDVGVTERTLSVDGAPASLSDAGCTTEVFMDTGTVQLVATAVDAAGNLTTEMLSLQVVDPNDVDRPEITLVSPAPGTLLGGPIDIVASVQDDQPTALTWRVERRRAGLDETWVEIATGSGPVTAAPVARLDTTSIANGSYDVRIVGDDGINPPYAVQFPLDVATDFKLGDFSYSETDLTVATAGFPIAVNRIYSTLDADGGDFGPGWRLGLSGGLRDSAPEQGTLLERAYTSSTRVYVTLPTGQLQVFRFAPQGGFFLGQQALFEAEGLTSGSLRPAEVEDSICFLSGGAFFTPFEPYNPSRFIYTDAVGNEFLMDEAQGLVQITDTSGETIDVTEDGVTSSRGPAINFERDAEGRIVRVIGTDDDPAAAPDPTVIEYAYDTESRLASAGAAGVAPVEYRYEETRFPLYLTCIVDPSGTPRLRNKYDDRGVLIAQCDADGDVSTCAGCDTFTVDAAAAFQTITTAAGDRIDLYYSDLGHLVRERRWLDGTEFIETVRTYDEAGRILAEGLPTGAANRWTYDEEGRMLSFTSAGGQSWTYLHGSCGVTAIIGPGGDVSTVHYDDECRATGMTDPLGDSFSVTYDERGRLATWTNEEGGTIQYLYDPVTERFAGFVGFEGNGETVVTMENDRFESRTDREGRTREFTFDEQERLIQERWDDGTVIDVTYSTQGFLGTMDNGEVRLEFSYWPAGQLKEQRTIYASDGAVERVVYAEGSLDAPSLGYDLRGNVTSVLDSHGGQTAYEYDGLGRVTALVWPGAPGAALAGPGVHGGTATRAGTASGSVNQALQGAAGGSRGVLFVSPAARVEFGWDDPVLGDSWLIRTVDRVPGNAGDPATVRTRFGYGTEGEPQTLESIEHTRVADGAVLHALTLALDARGLPTSWSDAEGTHAIELDGVGRILTVNHPPGAAPDESYGYDGNGNRTTAHNDGNLVHSVADGSGSDRLLSSDSFDLTYDGVGSVLQLVERGAGGATYDFTYDHLRRPRSVVRTVGGVVERMVEMIYDPLGRLVEERIDGAVRRHVYDGVNAFLIVDGAGTVLERRLQGRTGYDELWAVARPAGAGAADMRWSLVDHVGTVRDWVSADGTTIDHLIYDTFGNPVAPIDPALPSPGFHSRDRVADTPFQHFRARLYDPRQGRFLGEDVRRPWGYAFAENNPTYYGDPNGESALLQYSCLSGMGLDMAFTIGNVSGQVFRLSMEAASLGLTNGQSGGMGGPGSATARGREAVQTFLTGITIDVALTKLPLELPCAGEILDVSFEVAAAQGVIPGGGIWSRLFGNTIKNNVGPPLMNALGL